MNKIEVIKKLREVTGMGLSDCRKALNASEWDLDRAVEYVNDNLRQSDKPVGAGAIFAYIHHNQEMGVLLELHCGTDFVSGSDDFHKLGNMLAMHVAAMSPQSVEELLSLDCLNIPGITVGVHINMIAARFNEPIKVIRFQKYALGVSR